MKIKFRLLDFLDRLKAAINIFFFGDHVVIISIQKEDYPNFTQIVCERFPARFTAEAALVGLTLYEAIMLIDLMSSNMPEEEKILAKAKFQAELEIAEKNLSNDRP